MNIFEYTDKRHKPLLPDAVCSFAVFTGRSGYKINIF